ncbi:hypothetical protein MANES_11G078800v8 [Manihot esculenta]|uniref:Uncharacterized protein n=1 Tax=Manihot esculenta TaxID=3983 RepID=A0ACB7GUR1_MANES|nr:hypothetical protein MANES_11G078800v8 [Manihot esculenta]
MKSTTQASEPLYPSISPHMPEEAGLPSTSAQDVEKQQYSAPSSSSSLQLPSDTESNEKYWGTHVMGIPAVPTCHPDNKKAALWGAATDSAAAEPHHHPYLQYTPVDKPSSSPMESILQKFNSWSKKTETMAHNIWHNLRTSPSVSEAAWGKMNLTAKALTGGGFETLYKNTFATYANEKLKKTFACYLSTSTGPVAGTLYLSDVHAAFCSDRPLSFTAPSGQETWSYYKVSKIFISGYCLNREFPMN